MKSIKKKVVGFLSLILLTQPLAAGAAEIADIKFEKQYTAPETGLELKGVGLLRYLGLFKVYAGAFYLEEGTPINEALADRAKRLEVEYLRAFKGEDFGPATVEMMKKNVDKATIEKLRQQIDHHNSLYEDVGPGGDVVLMTDPGYPAYRASIYVATAEPYAMPITEKNGYLPDFEKIPPHILKRAKAMFLNYPNNPTGACATRAFFSRAVEFAKAHEIAICHDNPYSEILFDSQEHLSFLSVPGAKDVGIELNSLSKPYNMTGWRIGMALGNKEILTALCKVKENTDSGIFNAIQYAAIRALKQEDANIHKMLEIYSRRRKLVLETFAKAGMKFVPQKGTFYLWVPVPKGTTSIDFTTTLFEKAAVVVAAGTAYGQHGEGYIRISLTVPDRRLEEAMERIQKVF